MIKNLEEVVDSNTFGHKACNLKKIMDFGYKTPPGFVISQPEKTINNRDVILKYAKNLGGGKFAVRSSADIEDGVISSFAGIFVSHLHVSINELCEKIIDCEERINHPIVASYKNAHSISSAIKIAVIVQKMVGGIVSGVGFSQNPNSGDGIIIESFDGECSDVVSGKIKPIQHVNQYQACDGFFSKEKFLILKYVLSDLEQKFQYPVDTEWLFDVNQDLYILQTRPITKALHSDQSIIDNLDFSILQGCGASGGIFSGEVLIVEDLDDLKNVRENSIIVAKETSPEYFLAMFTAGGIVTEKGGLLCHAAVTAREIGKPCIVGVDQLMRTVKNGDQIKIDGNTGLIYKK